MMGMVQATEAVKILLGLGETLAGRLLLYDAARMHFRSITIRRNSACPACGDKPSIRELIDYEHFCSAGAQAAGATTQEQERPVMEQITVEDLKKRIDAGEDLVILDVRNPDEHEKGAIPGARLIPLQELPKHVLDMEDLKDREVLVHCQMGGRSSRACAILSSRGFAKPVNVEGGYEAWQKLTQE
jgi:adenylyltransferase/sulfurtransferase